MFTVVMKQTGFPQEYATNWEWRITDFNMYITRVKDSVSILDFKEQKINNTINISIYFILNLVTSVTSEPFVFLSVIEVRKSYRYNVSEIRLKVVKFLPFRSFFQSWHIPLVYFYFIDLLNGFSPYPLFWNMRKQYWTRRII